MTSTKMLTTAQRAAESYYWYALRVPPQKEFIAQTILRRRGLATFLPVERVWRRKNKFVREKVLRSYPLMPRHVFTGFPKKVPMWFDVFSLPAVQGVVGISGTPMLLDEGEMARVMHLYQNAIDAPKEQKWMATHHEFSQGGKAQVIGGPFDGLTVPVVSIGGAHAKVLVDLFNGQTVTEIPLQNLVAAA